MSTGGEQVSELCTACGPSSVQAHALLARPSSRPHTALHPVCSTHRQHALLHVKRLEVAGQQHGGQLLVLRQAT